MNRQSASSSMCGASSFSKRRTCEEPNHWDGGSDHDDIRDHGADHDDDMG